MLVSGCSDNQITEIDHLEDEEPPEVVINEEPPELVQAYQDLWMEIRYEQERGIIDSTKVRKANLLAVELSKYDGTMAQVFRIMEDLSNGKSLAEISEGFHFPNGIGKTSSPPCERGCLDSYKTAAVWSVQDATNDAEECNRNGIIGAGVAVGALSPLGLAGVAVATAACLGDAIEDLFTDLDRLEKLYRICLGTCPEKPKDGPV